MHYDVKDPYFKQFKVFLDGILRNDALEADDDDGWAIVNVEVGSWWGQKKSHPKKLYGRIHIVRYLDTVEEEEEEDKSESEKDSEETIEEPTYD